MTETLSSISVSTKLCKVAELARQAPKMVLTTLAHHIDIEFLHEAFKRTRKDGSPGIDGQTWRGYAENLEDNLQSLLDRFKSGGYRAPAVRRIHIPKGDGKSTRPIGIPTLEDKVLQRAVTMLLEAVYEQDFLDCSYGFRPGRSAHDALDDLQRGLTNMGGGWVIEVDIKSFFDTMDHGHLRVFLDQRVRDGVIRRTIGKWLNAGVLEDGNIFRPEKGTPQGGVISPVLSNIYLHEVLDKWFEETVKPQLSRRAFLIRYADDAAIVLASEQDALRVMKVLPKRFGKFGLDLHPEKTRLLRFRNPASQKGGDDSSPPDKPGTFDLLGFTHYWAKSRRGFWVVKKKTASKRFKRGLQRIYEWCKLNRHMTVRKQHRILSSKLRGHYQYYGVTGNFRMLVRFEWEVKRAWHKWLNRRSQRGISRENFSKLLKRYPLPPVRITHVFSY